jgi:hypothetical protein
MFLDQGPDPETTDFMIFDAQDADRCLGELIHTTSIRINQQPAARFI